MIITGRQRAKRAPLEILMDMMATLRANGKLGPTRIMYTSNLSWDLMRRHLTTLVFSKLVATTPESEFFLTPRGAECLAMFEQASLMITPAEDPSFTLPKGRYVKKVDI